MNIKQTVKKVTALATGTLMLGATVMGAVAYDLSDYPYPFIQDGAFSGKIVVGTRGSAEGIASDYLGIADISTSLQAASKTPVSVSGGTVDVEGGELYDELPLNGNWTKVVLKETKLDGFVDSTIDFDDQDIDYHDELEIGTDALSVATSLTEEEFDGDLYMTVDADKIKYKVVFDDLVNNSKVTNDETLEFKMLGKTIEVTDIVTDNEVIIKASSEYFLEEGDKVTIDGHDVTLVRVGQTSVIVEVDGQREVITEGSSETFEDAGDFEVSVDSIFYIEGATDNGANLELGLELSQTAKNGDAAELFGEPSNEDEAEWHWIIDMTQTPGAQSIGVQQTIDRIDLDCNDVTERCAIAFGEGLDLPNNYATIWFYALEEPTDYTTLSMVINNEFDLDDGNGAAIDNVPGIVFTTDSGDEDFVVGTIETDKVWVVNNATATRQIWYKDGDDEVYASGATSFKVVLDDDVITVTPPANLTDDFTNFTNLTEAWSMSFENVDELYFWADVDAGGTKPYFGLNDEDESEELQYKNGSSSFNVGSLDYTLVTNYGAAIEATEDQLTSGNGNQLEIMLPLNQQKATIVVTSRGSQIAASSEDGAYVINPLPVGLVVKDTEAQSMLGSENLLVVGGPYVNSVAAELMGNPTAEQIEQMFEPGRAKIVLFDDMNAILVAGYSAQDTVGASRVLARYETYDLTGSEVEVVVPSLASLSVTAPTLPSTVDDLDVEETVME